MLYFFPKILSIFFQRTNVWRPFKEKKIEKFSKLFWSKPTWKVFDESFQHYFWCERQPKMFNFLKSEDFNGQKHVDFVGNFCFVECLVWIWTSPLQKTKQKHNASIGYLQQISPFNLRYGKSYLMIQKFHLLKNSLHV